MTLLSPGDEFPALSLTLPGGDTLTLTGGFGVVLFFRGRGARTATPSSARSSAPAAASRKPAPAVQA